MVIAGMRRHLIKLLRCLAKLCGGVPKRRYGGGAGGDLGGAGRQLERLLLVVYKGGEAEDAEEEELVIWPSLKGHSTAHHRR